MAADPRGDMVFVAGSTRVAYNAATGAKVWENEGSGRSVAVSPDGRSVFVIRSVRAGGSTWDFSTAAFDAATGRQLWASRYNGRANKADAPAAIAASPRGGAVFVTGTSVGRRSGLDYATVAYNSATGAPLWTKRYNGRANGPDTASSVAASHDGGRVFVTGASKGRGTGLDCATVGYSTATGTPFWTRRYNGPANGSDTPVAVLVSLRGAGTVIMSGTSPSEGSDYLSVAYTTFNGVTRWVSRFPQRLPARGPARCGAQPGRRHRLPDWLPGHRGWRREPGERPHHRDERLDGRQSRLTSEPSRSEGAR